MLVSTIGSRSFRLIYLPDGAQMIIVGPPQWRLQDGQGSFPFPFDETDRCWGFLGYVNVLRHHVVKGLMPNQPETEESDYDHKEYIAQRDQMVYLQNDTFIQIIRHALDSIHEWVAPDFSSGLGR